MPQIHVTGAQKCSYVTLLAEETVDAKTLFGEANIFVSHSWGMPFDELVETLEDHN